VSYRRVLPRDLFNEANLLKCLGALWIKIDDRIPEGVSLDWLGDEGEPFEIEQDRNSGALSVYNLRLTVKGRPVHLSRPLNSRNPWPLYVEPNGDDEWFDPVAVFTDDGDLTEEFERLAGLIDADGDA
jgi:hypothetical protein